MHYSYKKYRRNKTNALNSNDREHSDPAGQSPDQEDGYVLNYYIIHVYLDTNDQEEQGPSYN